MNADGHPAIFVVIGVLVFWAGSAAMGNEAEAECGIQMMKMRSCQQPAVPREEVMTVPASPDWDEPIYAIYLSHLAPLFAACNCPFYGVEETQSWNDPEQPDLHWWQITVVLGVLTDRGWELRSRDYLFSAKEAESPQLASLGPESPWPVTAVMAH